MKSIPISAVLGFALVAASARSQNQLAIRKIVLYKHGVGYFERQGSVDGDQTVTLSFTASQMKDVLKSLYAVDLGGGRIATILYDSKDPIQKQLEGILFDVPEGNALTQFLKQLKGARVRAQVGARPVEGRILGIEPVSRTMEAGITTTHKLVLLKDEGQIQPIELFDASEIEVLDESVRRDLDRMMEIYAKARYADRKIVQLRAEGNGQRDVRAGYIIETPIWKTSYRLLLEENGPSLLQGWAIVENRTDEDWKDVRLTFVAGSPLSFVLDLYTSYYPQRPVVAMEIAAADSGIPPPRAAADLLRKAVRLDSRARGLAGEDLKREAAKEAAPGRALGGLLAGSMAPVTRGVEIGDLFAYEAKGPVSIKQGQAALVPILLEKLDQGRKVLYFRQQLSEHPSHAFYLANSTELTLEKGPITVFEGSTCLGEGMLQKTLKQGMHAVVPYALETGVEVEPRVESKNQPITRATLVNGVLTLEHAQIRETRYRLRNKTKKAHALILDHPKAGGSYKLVEPAEADEELPAAYRFEVALAAGGERVHQVQERRRVDSQVSLVNQSASQIRFYLSQPYMSEKTRDFLQGIAGLMDERAERDRRVQSTRAEASRISKDQERLRKNIAILRDSPNERTMRDRYLTRLAQGDERLDKLEGEIRQATAERQQLDQRIRGELQKYRDS